MHNRQIRSFYNSSIYFRDFRISKSSLLKCPEIVQEYFGTGLSIPKKNEGPNLTKINFKKAKLSRRKKDQFFNGKFDKIIDFFQILLKILFLKPESSTFKMKLSNLD
jgi:hypothetical protein